MKLSADSTAGFPEHHQTTPVASELGSRCPETTLRRFLAALFVYGAVAAGVGVPPGSLAALVILLHGLWAVPFAVVAITHFERRSPLRQDPRIVIRAVCPEVDSEHVELTVRCPNGDSYVSLVPVEGYAEALQAARREAMSRFVAAEVVVEDRVRESRSVQPAPVAAPRVEETTIETVPEEEREPELTY